MQRQRCEIRTPHDHLGRIHQVDALQNESDHGEHHNVRAHQGRGDPRIAACLTQPCMKLADRRPALISVGASLGQGVDHLARLLDRSRPELDYTVATQGSLVPEAHPVALAPVFYRTRIALDDIDDRPEGDGQLGPMRNAQPVVLPATQHDLLRADLGEPLAIERYAAGFRFEPAPQSSPAGETDRNRLWSRSGCRLMGYLVV